MEKCYAVKKNLRVKFRTKKDHYNLLSIYYIYIPLIILVHYFLPNYENIKCYY